MAIDPTAALSSLGSPAVPPIDPASLPAAVRNGTAQDKKAYTAALSFEQMLIGQLTQSLTDTTDPAGSSDSGSSDSSSDSSSADGTDSSSTTDPSLGVYQQMLPEQLASAITAGGGLGLAADIYKSFKA